MQLLEITEILLIYNFYKIEMWQDLKLVFICVCSISQFAAKSHTSEDSAISPQALDHQEHRKQPLFQGVFVRNFF